MRNSLANSHPFSKLIFSLFIILLSFLVFILLGIVIAIPIFNLNIFEIQNATTDFTNPTNLNFLKYLQTLQAVGLFIIPAFIIGYFLNENSFAYLSFTKKIKFQTLFAVLVIMLCSLPLINMLAKVNSEMQFPEFLHQLENWMKEKESTAQELTEAFLKMDSLSMLAFNIFMIGILPAIGEELIFRGVFQRIFTEWTKNIHWGILIAAILFSGMHMQFYGFVPRLILGVLFGYIFYWSGSIWIPITAHFVNNTAAVIVYYFYPDSKSEEIENFGATQGTYVFLFISAIIVGYLLWRFYRVEKKITRKGSGYDR
ncbi:MAG: lysostaphin resistance A-like protein [Bacteroidales bacterium]